MVEEWPELTELVEQVRSDNAEGWQRTERLRQELGGLQPHLELIAAQFAELDIEGHLRLLNERLLAGMGNLESIHSGMGIERVAALAWPVDFHPQQTGEETARSGMFRIEVWMGPGLQDGRARIRIAGAKRLEAVLPTSAERFRTALLAVFRNPLFVASSSADGTQEEAPAQEQAPTQEQPPTQEPPPPEEGTPDLTKS